MSCFPGDLFDSGLTARRSTAPTRAWRQPTRGSWLHALHGDGPSRRSSPCSDPSGQRSPPFLGWKKTFFFLQDPEWLQPPGSRTRRSGRVMETGSSSVPGASQLTPPLPPVLCSDVGPSANTPGPRLEALPCQATPRRDNSCPGEPRHSHSDNRRSDQGSFQEGLRLEKHPSARSRVLISFLVRNRALAGSVSALRHGSASPGTPQTQLRPPALPSNAVGSGQPSSRLPGSEATETASAEPAQVCCQPGGARTSPPATLRRRTSGIAQLLHHCVQDLGITASRNHCGGERPLRPSSPTVTPTPPRLLNHLPSISPHG